MRETQEGWATRACRRLTDGTAVYTVGGSEPSIRLDRFLKERIPKLSRRRIQEAIRERVDVEGRGAAKPARRLQPGDTVLVRPSEPPDEADPTESVPVLFEDEDLFAIDKPAGLLAHPSNHVRKGSVAWILARDHGGPIHLVHRLDRETSGVMLVARHPAAARALSAQLGRDRGGAAKCYLAVVFGRVAIEEATIDLPIGRALRSAVYVKRGINRQDGRASQTRFRVLDRSGGFSLLRVTLLTGRRHQIRVHLAAAGHAVVGDKLYGPAESHYLRFIRRGFDDRMRRELLAERQLLHAARIDFSHPRDGRPLSQTAPLPADMRDFLERSGLSLPAAWR
ncbi:MAG TPA: RluA family pseudouridine synthase [Candidatus Polarisedimenticolia bacterium]|nr:RluA family pseudouridine synthase [Candidatus Polarisedimenticolia bacterium]